MNLDLYCHRLRTCCGFTFIECFHSHYNISCESSDKEDLMQAFQGLMKEWREWIKHTEVMSPRNYQAYVILTMCRALYTVNYEEFVSKKEAALWAEKELPEWSSLIQRALLWREAWRDEQVDGNATLQETLGFVHFVLSQCEKDAGVS